MIKNGMIKNILVFARDGLEVYTTGRNYDYVAVAINNGDSAVTVITDINGFYDDPANAGAYTMDLYPGEWTGFRADADGYATLEYYSHGAGDEGLAAVERFNDDSYI